MTPSLRTRMALLGTAAAGLVAWVGLHAEPPAPAKPAQPSTQPTIVPKLLSDATKKGLAWLAEHQQADGGWSQGGGWRTNVQGGGRVEGANVADPSDVGNTAIATLAFLRAGSTPVEGPYKENLAKAVAFIRSRVEKADSTSLWVTDIKGTQLQSKIGTYVDTFLAAMVLSEVKGKMADEPTNELVLKALNKTVAKIEKNQDENGQFAGNAGWATVLSQGLANKGLYAARAAGAKVSEDALKRVERQVAQAAQPAAPAAEAKPVVRGGAVPAATPLPAAVDGIRARRAEPALGLGGFAGAAGPSDAGVALYKDSARLNNIQDIAKSIERDEQKAKETLARKDATETEKKQAQEQINQAGEARKIRDKAVEEVVTQIQRPGFVAGFGSNGGEEFLSYLNISETLLAQGGEAWTKWDKQCTETITRAQDKDGSWSGQHCITGKTFCTAAALLVLMADRGQVVNLKK